jgi:hypothetical protein
LLMSKQSGRNIQTKNKSDFPQNVLWVCLWIEREREINS